MVHPQPATPMKVENSTYDGIMNRKIQKMRFYWARDRVKQKHFSIFWNPGVINLGYYMTKHHSPVYHKVMIPLY